MSVTRKRFAVPQRVMHWVMATCILAMLFIGVGMMSTISLKYLTLVQIHKSLGIAILVLVVVRLGMRLYYGAPELPADLPVPIKLAAEGSQVIFYVLMFVMPLLGWGMLSAGNLPIVVFGGVHLPAITPVSPQLHAVLWQLHHYLAFAFFALILGHVGAALAHKMIRKDGVFEAMASTAPDDEA